MDQKFLQSWKRTVPNFENILEKMQEKTIIAVGGEPYPRLTPALFLNNYAIYSVKNPADIDLLRNYTNIFSLEEKFPKAAVKIHSTSYLLGNYAFQAFLKSRREPFRLIFTQVLSPSAVKVLKEQGVEWLGNGPETIEDVFLKGKFRNLLKNLGLAHLPDWKISKDEFLAKNFAELYQHWEGPIVIQRADFDVNGEQGTFFVKEEKDWCDAYEILSKDTRYKEIQICPLIEGPSVSMLGCITHLGVLTSNLQLQLIDVPEALHGQLPTGVFLGHDWGFRAWTDKAEKTAQDIMESAGGFLAEKGFKGIFGIDFVCDQKREELFPLECNPRFTAALPMYSLMITNLNKIPPIEFFHLMAQLDIKEDFDFRAVNEGLKERAAVSHISLTPKGIYEMKTNLVAGVYSFSPENLALRYERPGAFLWDIKNDLEFIVADSVPRFGSKVAQDAPTLFRLIFPRSIASSSFSIDPKIGQLITVLSMLLRKDQTPPKENLIN